MGIVFYLLPENKTVIVTSDGISVYCRKHPDVHIAWNPDIYVGAHLFKENASPMLDSDGYEVEISNALDGIGRTVEKTKLPLCCI